MEDVTVAKITELLDCAAYYTLMKLPLPSNRDSIIHNMIDEQFVKETVEQMQSESRYLATRV